MKISIIILSFNHYDETTGQCLSTLAADPDFLQWEVIVVDNASDPATQQKLTRDSQRYPHVTFIFNEKNLGFAAGNNVGIRKATGEVIVLLNSDAFPPAGMIARLLGHFDGNRSWGMLGPVTNAAGNEQLILTQSKAMEGKIAEGLQYAHNGSADVLDAYRMDFFCVAIPRKVMDQIGLLDEDFGRGYYEDLDFSLRVKQAGYRLGVAEDAFVYHRGSSSFGKVPREIKELMKRNKRLIYSKHGRHVDIPHIRTANLCVLKQYANKKIAGATVSEYRIANRLHHARANLPKGWFKRWRYLRALAAVEKKLANIDGVSGA